MEYRFEVDELHIDGDRVSMKFMNNWNYGDWVYMTIPEWEEVGSPKPKDVLVMIVRREG